jgi:hypothetical protein
MLIIFIIFPRFSVVIQDKVEEGLDNVVIIPISVIVLDENDNAPRYTVQGQCRHHSHLCHCPGRE